mmetsp:Transcript_59123/g.183568  ORF Transcript_59123/g.183568 Transcript_59123/m.183568 type:complete len:186 (-) Transcript_59123:28-585(-)
MPARPLLAALAALAACPSSAGRAEHLRAKRWAADGADGSGSSGSGDYMDRYIAASHGPAGSAWWASPTSSPPAQGREPASDFAGLGDASRWSPMNLRDVAGSGAVSSAQPRRSAAGAVVDVKLDSELQTSKALLVQREARSAPNVEAAVAAQRQEDVYIHDVFSKAAAQDSAEQRGLEDNKDLKP